MSATLLPTIEHVTGPDPRATLVVLHGLGADGHDFEPLVGQLDLDDIGDVRFVLPHAPVRPVTLNAGYEMRAWYDIRAAERGAREDAAGLEQSRLAIEALLAREVERGVAPGRIVLMGFSQGCAMALLAGLLHGQRLAGIAGLSGYLPLAAQTLARRSAAAAGLPVFLAHGSHDGVLPVAWGRETREQLAAAGHPVQWHEYAMDHAVCQEEVADLERWLLELLR